MTTKFSAFTAGGAVGDANIVVGLVSTTNTKWTASQWKTYTSDSPTLVTPNLGTPTAGVLSSCSAYPLSALTGAGTGVLTALGVNVGSAGAPVLFNGAGGTPSSMTATNLTGTASGLTAGTASAVAVGGITGLGTGVSTALAVNVGSAGAFVVNGGALGTPSSGTLTSCTGLPAAGVVGTAAILGANTFTATQTINPAANTTAIAVSGYSLTSTNTTSAVSIAGTLNGTGITNFVSIAATVTTANSSSRLFSIMGGSGGTTLLTDIDTTGQQTWGRTSGGTSNGNIWTRLADDANVALAFRSGTTGRAQLIGVVSDSAGFVYLDAKTWQFRTGYDGTLSLKILTTAGANSAAQIALGSSDCITFGGNTQALVFGATGQVAVYDFTNNRFTDLKLRDLYVNNATYMVRGTGTWTAGATGNVPTLTAGPVSGNPTKWVAIDDNGTTRYIPTW